MRIQNFCLIILLIASNTHAKPISEDFKKLENLPEYDLSTIAAHLSDAELSNFQQVSRPFRDIAQKQFETRASYLWAKGEVTRAAFQAYREPVRSVFVSKDNHIISIGKNKRIYVWEWDGIAYKKIGIMVDDVKDEITNALFSPEKNRLVLNHRNNIINIWDIVIGGKINQFEVGPRNYLAISPDGTTLAEAGQNSVIKLWNITTGTPKQINTGVPGYLYSLAFSLDGKNLAFESSDRGSCVSVWNLESNSLDLPLFLRRSTHSLSPSFLPDGTLIAYDDNMMYKKVSIWSVQTGNLISTLKYDSHDIMITERLSHNGVMLSGQMAHKIVIWHIQSGKIIRELDSSCNGIALTFSPDDKMIVAGCHNGEIITWKATLPEKKEAKSIK